MNQWNDKNNKPHKVDIDLIVAQRLKAECDFDLVECLTDPKKIEAIFQRLRDETTLVVQLLAVIEDVQDPEAFGKLFSGATLVDANNALTGSIIDFFPNPQKEILRRMQARTTSIADQMASDAIDQATKAMDSPEFSTALKEYLTAGSGFTESSESSTTPEKG